MLPLYFISGVFVSVSVLPHWLVTIAGVFPVRHLAAALLVAYNPHTRGSGFAGADLLVVAAWGGRRPARRAPPVQLGSPRALNHTKGSPTIGRNIMATEIRSRAGHCPTHGTVEATREIPRLQFPFIVFVVLRSIAKRRAFVCPRCGARVETH